METACFYSEFENVELVRAIVLYKVKKAKPRAKEKAKGIMRRRIEPERLMWKPPVFTASSRTWNW